jgi:hypothetical protein
MISSIENSSICSSSSDNSVIQSVSPLPFPKIIRKDIRRLYVDMFANVANASEMLLAEGFYKEFTTPNMEYSQTQDAFITVDNKPVTFELAGQSIFLQYWFNHILLVPDMTWRFTNTRIITQSPSKLSRVEFNFELCGTMLYDLHFLETVPTQIEQEKIILQQQSSSPVKKRKISQPTNNQFPQYNHRMVDQISSATLLKRPQDFKLSCLMKMYLNEEKRITKMNCHCIQKILIQ